MKVRAAITAAIIAGLLFIGRVAGASDLTGPQGGWMNKTITGPIVRGGIQILLSNASVPSTATIGTIVGALSVTGGIGSYTFTLTGNPGSLFSISGSNLEVAASLTAGSDPITIQANNGAGSIVTQPFVITVTGNCSNELDFSQACNSQYLF